MKISTSTISVIKTRGLETGMKALADAGFEAIDYSLTQNGLPLDIDFLQNAISVLLPCIVSYLEKNRPVC